MTWSCMTSADTISDVALGGHRAWGACFWELGNDKPNAGPQQGGGRGPQGMIAPRRPHAAIHGSPVQSLRSASLMAIGVGKRVTTT